MNDLVESLGDLRIVFLDCDGVLTSGVKYYSSVGAELMRFHVRDGYGIRCLISRGIDVRIISRSDSPIILKRANDLGNLRVYLGVTSKAELLRQVMSEDEINGRELAYIGDDIFDIDVRPFVRIFACPNDALLNVREDADIVLSEKGGGGAVREFCDLVVRAKSYSQFSWSELLADRDAVLITLGSGIREHSRGINLAMDIRDNLVARSIRCELDGYRPLGNHAAQVALSYCCGRGFKVMVSSIPDTGDCHEFFICDLMECCDCHQSSTQVYRVKDLCELIYEALETVFSEEINQLKIDSHNFIKVAPISKSEQEVEWHCAVTNLDNAQSIIPKMLASVNNHCFIGYAVEFVSGYSLREILTNDRLLSIVDTAHLVDAFDVLLKGVDSTLYVPINGVTLDPKQVFEYYLAKLRIRTRMLNHIFGGTHEDLVRHSSSLGLEAATQVIAEPSRVLEALKGCSEWPSVICPPKPTLIHGDMHFGNIIFGMRSEDTSRMLYLVDGKNQRNPGVGPAIGDPAYDCGKLLQSIEFRMDRLIVGVDSLSTCQSYLQSSIHTKVEHVFVRMTELVNCMIDRIADRLDDEYFRIRSRLLLSLHMITMPPCLPKLSRDVMALFYMQGVVLLNQIIHELLDTEIVEK